MNIIIRFGYGLFDESNKAFRDSINLFVNSPGSETVDFDLSYTYAGLETNSSGDLLETWFEPSISF